MILLFFAAIHAEIFDSVRISVNNGFIEELRYRKVKIIEPYRISQYTNYSIPYDERIDSVSVIFARNIAGNDTINLQEKSINRVIFNRLPEDGYPYFPFLKELVISFPGVRKNSILESEVKIIRKNPFGNELNLLQIFSKNKNEKKSIFLRIDIPEQEIKIKEHLISVNIDSFKYEKRKVYEMRVDSFYDLPDESNLPPYGEIIPYIGFTTLSWDEINEYFVKLLNLFNVKDKSLSLENLKKFRIIRLNLKDISYIPRNPEEIIKSNIATPFEISLMLKSVFKEGDFIIIPEKRKEFYIIENSDKWNYYYYNPIEIEIDKNFPSLHYFNHLLFEKDGKFIYIGEPLYGSSIPFWSTGVTGIRIKDEGIKFVDIKEPSKTENLLDMEEYLKMEDGNDLYVRFLLKAKGFYAFSIRTRYSQINEKERLEALKAGIVPGELIDLKYEDKEDSIIIKGEYKIKEGFVRQKNLLFLELHIPFFIYNTLNNELYEIFRKDNREKPFDLRMKKKEIYKLSIEIPEGYKPYIYPEGFKNNIKAFLFSNNIRIEKKNIIYKEEIEVKKPLFNIEDINQILKSMKKDYFSKRNLIVFIKR